MARLSFVARLFRLVVANWFQPPSDVDPVTSKPTFMGCASAVGVPGAVVGVDPESPQAVRSRDARIAAPVRSLVRMKKLPQRAAFRIVAKAATFSHAEKSARIAPRRESR